MSPLPNAKIWGNVNNSKIVCRVKTA